MSETDFLNISAKLSSFIPSERIFFEEINNFVYGTDASFYRLIPRIVIKIDNDKELITLIKYCSDYNVPLTFRAAGTSLSGQAITDSILVTFTESYNDFEISNDGDSIILRPGVIGSHANQALTKYEKKIGPDPASINACKIGGIAANNASGMTSGIKHNVYNTLENIKIIFANGSELDTYDESSRTNFVLNNSQLIIDLKNLAEEVKSNTQLAKFISNKFKLKNTCGYGLNSLIDYEDPLDIISHLMVGSEGTLGFISEVMLRTVDNYPNRATSLIIFNNISDACNSVQDLDEALAEAVELMDYASLVSVKDKPEVPEYLQKIKKGNSALLVETTAASKIILQNNIDKLTKHFSNFKPEFPIEFTEDKNKYIPLWNVRKGLFPTACKNRKLRTTVIIEDINFPVAKLAEAVEELQSILIKHNYEDSVIWGHALSGNIHFVLFQNFGDTSETIRYNTFLNELTEIVINKFNGSLKSEHGTGRNMAPFVKQEWGEEAYSIMERIKRIFDPNNILNPGVILNSDPEVHLKNLKEIPIVNPLIDKCIECGFCEPICPSKDLTYTPRQRITLWRNQSHFDSTNLSEKLLNYNFEETCAADGLCATSCPVDIDTGKLVKEYRESIKTQKEISIANFITNNFKIISSLVRFGLNNLKLLRQIFGEGFLYFITKLINILPIKNKPIFDSSLPIGAKKISHQNKDINNPNSVVYFPSCISRTIGNHIDEKNDPNQSEIVIATLKFAGFNILIPQNRDQLCCGMPFASKGFIDQANLKSEELISTLTKLSNNGQLPILFDTSPCALHIKEHLKKIDNTQLKIYSPTQFISKFLLAKLTLEKKEKTAVFHLTCSERKLGLEEEFKNIAKKCVEEVIIPTEINCCGFAGDKGFTNPELNNSALSKLKDQIDKNCNYGYSTSKTCEIGLAKNSGIKYKSIFYLINRCIKN